jgi:aryl-alcohol dehydrogenase-like predicted oxidoreductase
MPAFSRKGLEELQPVLAILRRVGGKYGKTPAQVALRWLIENPLVLPIPGAKTGAQAEANAGALTFSLSGDEVAELSAATMAWRRWRAGVRVAPK